MIPSGLAALTGLGVGYLMLLFACATAVDRGWLPRSLVRHPATHILALGVYASAWAIHGSLELAQRSGFGYLAYYLGVAGTFLLAPVLLIPIQRLSRTYQLASLADLFTFRFRSRWVGTLVTIVSLLAVLPLLALQVQTIGTSIYRLSGIGSADWYALGFSALIALFAMLFGARHNHLNARHDGLLAAIAFESLVKLAAMLALGAIALFGIFDGPADLQAWLNGPGQQAQQLSEPLDASQWRTLLLLFFAAALLMPHMFHITFAETLSRRTLLRAGWGLPLYLLLIALPIPLILWGAQRQGIDVGANNVAYLAFDLSYSWWADALAFLAGLAAASGTLIILSLALSGMLINHLVLVARSPLDRPNLYHWLRWLQRGLIAGVIAAGWLFYRLVGIEHDLSSLGLAAFVGMAQCLPGLLALLYWPGANRTGMVSGLCTGLLIWLLGLGLPLVGVDQPLTLLMPDGLTSYPPWYLTALTSLIANGLALILVSLTTPTSTGERAAAEACSVDAVVRPMRLPLMAANADEMTHQLSHALGESVAQREIERAQQALGQSPSEARPYALRRLRDRIQANLSGLMGPAIAQDIVDRWLPYRQMSQPATEDIHFVERRLEGRRTRLTGLPRELDDLRRHHRQTLLRLPTGLCVFGSDGELLMWNDALAKFSGIAASTVVGAHRNSLPTPWSALFQRLLSEPSGKLYKQPAQISGDTRFLGLRRSSPHPLESNGSTVILVEDQSEMKWLEDELVHSARLASIGQLAAGVAHEIGNPVTGISSLAQNLRYDTDNPELLETAHQIQELTTRISTIVSSLVGFAHGGRQAINADMVPVSIARVTDQALHLIQLTRSGEDICFVNRCLPQLQVIGDEQRLQQVMVNLLSNARDASPPGDTITIDAHIECDTAHGSNSNLLRISVTDNGEGIDPAIRDHLFEPFTTTKAPGSGTGLGLPLVHSIISEHNGQIDIESPPTGQAQGTRIVLRLPAHQEPPPIDEPL
ncbi:ATP-binding protein [Halomonas halocynthiae]|uniref:ATP-binding protein n=1 Tax=Halomonas halocynthiae TaxID=176290 RepID=UPI00040EEEC5|nr:ATP-binding protein [Halomonas halocynthiae]